MSPAQRLASVRGRIAAAAVRAGREAAEVTLIGAAKFQPVDSLVHFVEAGLADLGENRVQEAVAHREALTGHGLLWHAIGPLQSNKARQAARLFDLVHAVDRPSIAVALDRAAAAAQRTLSALVEVNLGGEESKHGFPPPGLAEAIAPLAELEHLRIEGLMAIPPPEQDAGRARQWLRRLRELRDELFSSSRWSGRAGWLSMGMSDDFELAVEEGATHVRVGTALFGPRAT